MSFIRNFWIFFLWTLIIIYLSFTPLKDWPKPTIFQKLYIDKLVHIFMYAMLCFLLLRSVFRQQGRHPLRYATIFSATLFSAALGIAIEILQPILTQYRQFEWLDMLANVAGVAVGFLGFKWFENKKRIHVSIGK